MENTTILHFLHSSPPENDEDVTARVEMADWLRDVVQDEDYNIGLQLQKGLQTGLMKSVLFGRNERGNQYFHRCVKWYTSRGEDTSKPEL
jgi:phenylpropionate dioxygenase-like ring-hydroxylating dioxygenase large terminal subunit